MRAQLKKCEENIAKIQGQLVVEKRQKKRFKLQNEAGKKVLTNNAELSEVLPELSIELKKLLETLYLICLYLMAFTLNIYGLLSKNKIFCIMDTLFQ